ncbi:MAG: mechanosensitive ion channel family protein [Proteobacteria bacterium]|nr:mechanosensitive ion channel family protein [Pseudomonadota bacterium]MBU1056773.1 mechanosensitive ion channel family protein [Pseudomonadota bacterium]
MNELFEKWFLDPIVGKLIATTLVLIAVVVLVRLIGRGIGQYIDNSERRYRLRKLVSFAGYVLAIFLLSIVYSDKLAGLTVFFGVAGAGVAFALQEVIASAAGWITMSFGSFYKVGDRVQLGGIKGDVIDIGVLRSTLMECGGWINGDQYNGRVVRVANSFIFKEPVYNYSADFPFLWDEITIPIRYGSNYEMARKEFQQILDHVTGEHARHLKGEWRKMTDKYMLENVRLEPMVTLNMKENWAEYTLRYVVDYKQRRSTKDKICVLILQSVERSDGEIKLGSSSFEVASIPALDINVRNRE